MQLNNGDWVIVCDAGKYVAYENNGDTDRLDLRTRDSGEFDNSPTRELGTDRPGRLEGPNAQKSAVEQTDWHDQEEKRFVGALADKMDAWAASAPNRKFVLVADPRSMGTLRKSLKEATMAQVRHTITGDHVHGPVSAIEKLVSEA